jgi:ABC-type multidrug transport system fused ATPase/permease subunit
MKINNQYKVKFLPFNTIDNLILLLSFLRPKRRTQLCLLLLLMIINAGAEILSISSVYPLLIAITDTASVESNPLVSQLIGIVPVLHQSNNLVLILVALFICLMSLATLIRVCTLWLTLRLSSVIGSDLSVEAFDKVMRQDYLWFTLQNSSNILTVLTEQASCVVLSVTATLNLLSAALVVFAIFAGLFFVNKLAALLILLLLSGVYASIAMSFTRELRDNSTKISHALKNQIKVIQEAWGGIQEILLCRSQLSLIQKYRSLDVLGRSLRSRNALLASIPRPIIEAMAILVLALTMSALVILGHDISLILPFVAIFSLSIQRMLPNVQSVYSSWVSLRSYSESILDLQSILALPRHAIAPTGQNPIIFEHGIEFENVSFRYSDESDFIIKNNSFTIMKGERVGIIGPTGSGKSTLINLMMGLLRPCEGKILIDNHVLDSGSSWRDLSYCWQVHVAHVPQSIYLTDSTILDNVSLGDHQHEVDFDGVIEACKKAQISGFIETLPEGYNSLVGERGVQLSGGQRQRIGIARALYKKANILFLDEATSALDGETESSVMEAISSLESELTIVVIAHRTETLKFCDRIFELRDGAITFFDPPTTFFKRDFISDLGLLEI